MKMHASTTTSVRLAPTTDTVKKLIVKHALHPDEVGILESDEHREYIVHAVHSEENPEVRSKENITEPCIRIPRGADLNGYLPITLVDRNAPARPSVGFEFGQGVASGLGGSQTGWEMQNSRGPGIIEGRPLSEDRPCERPDCSCKSLEGNDRG